jgi:hypothetical protein
MDMTLQVVIEEEKHTLRPDPKFLKRAKVDSGNRVKVDSGIGFPW